MNVSCPRCETTYRVDPRKVPQGGVRARCSECDEVFLVSAGAPAPAVAAAPSAPPAAAEPVAPDAAVPGAVAAPPEAPAPEATAAGGAPSFGVPDPHAKARRLARALISDIVVYHPERRERSLAAGTLRQEFREEIQKSWEEYVGQVGNAFARETPYFREALNELLAGGQRLF